MGAIEPPFLVIIWVAFGAGCRWAIHEYRGWCIEQFGLRRANSFIAALIADAVADIRWRLMMVIIATVIAPILLLMLMFDAILAMLSNRYPPWTPW